MDIRFTTREMVYVPELDSWDDESRERVHRELSIPRLDRWMLTAKALDATEVYFMGVRQRGTGE